MKLFKIHIIFAILFIVAIVAFVEMAGFVHSLPYASQEREFWKPRLFVVSMILIYGTGISWLLFSFYHLFMLLKKKNKPKDSV